MSLKCGRCCHLITMLQYRAAGRVHKLRHESQNLHTIQYACCSPISYETATLDKLKCQSSVMTRLRKSAQEASRVKAEQSRWQPCRVILLIKLKVTQYYWPDLPVTLSCTFMQISILTLIN